MQTNIVILIILFVTYYYFQMSKSIEDYREIVKVLKLQLLKIREENTSLSKTLGIATQEQTSSFTPRLQKFKSSNKDFAKHLYLFNLFGHKCELMGVTPEMIFRIADKKRDKKVSATDLTQVMKRLKLKFDDVEISRLINTITKGGSIFYQQYLQYINAFQINSQKYPPKSVRTYSQICLLRLGNDAKVNNNDTTPSKLCNQINNKDGGPYVSFENFSSYCKNKTKLKDSQIIGAFVALDMQSECQIDKQNFNREMGKVFDLLEKGINIDDEVVSQQSQIRTRRQQRGADEQKSKNDDYKIEEDTGVEKGATKKQPKKPVKLVKGDMNKIVQQLRKQGISANYIITKLLQRQQKRKLIRPFNISDFSDTLKQINKNVDKKKIMQLFKSLDSSSNGSISTDELVKLWLQGKQATDPAQILFKLLARHMKEVQSEQYITKFTTAGFEPNDTVKSNVINDVFAGLQLKEDYQSLIMNILPNNCPITKLVSLMETGGVNQTGKIFKPLPKKQYENMSASVKPLVPKQSKNFPKLLRLQEGQQLQKSYWETIFTNEWACWNYCLQAASKLTTFWRDPQFGPNNGDPNGYRSIVGNESSVPQGLPAEDEITWMSFEQFLQKQGKGMQQVKLFSPNLVANDIIQGKLGDCWYVSALSIITSNDEYVVGKSQKQCLNNPQSALSFGIHPKMFHIFRQYGLYVFKFFKGFKPVYVIVDDLFPVQISTNELIFAHSPDPGLQWVAFLQKSYAKLHHCYTNMISGDISQGLSDLTNTLPIKQDIATNNNPQQLLKKIMKLSAEGQLMGCSINVPKNAGVQQPVTLDDQRTGLFYGHAYSIQDYINLLPKSENYNLMRIRNPWGHGQWMLDWSDKPLNNDPDYAKLNQFQPEIDKFYNNKIQTAKKMRENYAEITQYKPGEDGQFLINFYDFAKIFSNLFTGYNFKGKQFTCYSTQGKWDKSMPSGVCKMKGATDAERSKFVKDNYQFILEVKQKTEIIMFLIQPDGRLYRGQKYPYKQICNGIIIMVFTLGSDKSLDKFDSTKFTLPTLKFELKREANFWHKFEPGRYAIVPCKMANKIAQTQFQFRAYTENPVNFKKVNGQGPDFKIVPKDVKSENLSALRTMSDFICKSK